MIGVAVVTSLVFGDGVVDVDAVDAGVQGDADRAGGCRQVDAQGVEKRGNTYRCQVRSTAVTASNYGTADLAPIRRRKFVVPMSDD